MHIQIDKDESNKFVPFETSFQGKLSLFFFLALGRPQGAWKYLLHAGGGQGAGRQIGRVALLSLFQIMIWHD